MTTLEWTAAVACLAVLAMLIEHKVGRRDTIEARSVPNAAHYGHSDVADSEYDELPRP